MVHRFLNMKTTHLLGMMVLFAAGAAMMIRPYRDEAAGRGATAEKDSETEQQKQKQEKEKSSSRSEPPSESSPRWPAAAPPGTSPIRMPAVSAIDSGAPASRNGLVTIWIASISTDAMPKDSSTAGSGRG